MLHTAETLQFIGRLCEKENGTYKFIAFEEATVEEKKRVIRFDNSFYFSGGLHIISNIDDVKKSIGYKDMSFEEFCGRVRGCIENGTELYDIDW